MGADEAVGSKVCLISGTLNNQPIDPDNPEITVCAGETINGSFSVNVFNFHRSGAVAPLAATVTWGDPSSSYWQINSWVGTGNTIHTVPVNVTAPNTPGIYYIAVATSGVYNSAQLMSGTHPAWPADWINGNKVALLPASDFETAINQCWIKFDLWIPPDYVTDVLAMTAIRINVGTFVTLNPSNVVSQQGETFCVDVDVAGETDLYAASFDVVYDETVITYQNATEGTFLSQNGADYTFMHAALLNGIEGQLVVGISRSGDIGGVSGSGNLAEICFDVIGDYCSTSDITFANAVLEGPEEGSTIPAIWNGSDITVTPPPAPTNLTATGINCSQIDLSWDAVTDADFYEIYRSDTSGGSFESIETITGTSYSDTTDCIISTRTYYYKVKAKSGDTCLSEFSYEDSATAPGLLGDINCDCRVDGLDLSILARAFGASEGDLRFNCLADLNRDGIIDGEDLIDLLANFGTTISCTP